MRKIKFSLFLCLGLLSFTAKSQYTYDQFGPDPYSSSNFLFTGSGFTTTGFTNIHAYNAGGTGNTWSSVQTLPFAFDFYGTPVTHFIVSKNYLLSFDTTLTGTTLPAGINDNSALPNSALPNNTISIFWDNFANGSGSLGTNDNVWTGVFGTAPNRQFFVKYYSYETGGRSFSYGHLVLEEGTNNIYMIDNYMGGTGGSMTIGVQLDNATAVQIAGSPNISPIVTSTAWTALEYYSFTPRLLSPNEAGISSVDAPSQPFASGMQTVTATLTNHGTAALTSANIDWSANGVAQTGTTFSGSLAPGSTTSINLGMYNFTGATNLSVWSSLPNGVADPFTANDTSMVTLVPSLAGGVYTIDGTQAASATNFINFASAVTAMSGGISGAVTFNVAAGTYNEQVSIGSIIGSSNTNTITFNGASAASTILTHDKSIRNSTLNLDGTSDITIKNMTIAATGGSDSWAIHIWNDANDVIIDSNIITTPVGTTFDVVGIMVSGSETSDNTTADVDDITISNNTVTGGERGISIYGNFTASSRSQNLTIHNNDVQNADDNGLYIVGYNNVTITDNYVDGLTNAFSDGMYSSDLENFTITGNRFKGGDNGLEANDYNFDNAATGRSIIANNMFIGNDDGLYMDDCEDIDVFHNSTSGADYGIYINDQVGLDIRNNIFTSSGGDIAFYYLDAATVSFTTLDYNLYYTTGPNIARSLSGNYADLAALQAGLGGNTNSVSGDPVFLNPTADLHASGSVANDVGDNTVGITVDFDGDTRPLAPSTTVDIGADEFAPPACAFPGALSAFNVSATTANLSWFENGTATMWEVEWDTAGYTVGSGRFSAIVSNDTTSISGLMGQTTYDWYVRAICTGPTNSSWSATGTFTTGCLPFTAPFSEDFSSLSLPTCWSQGAGNSENWLFSTTNGHLGNVGNQGSGSTTSGGGLANVDDSSPHNTNTTLESPFIDVSGLTTPRLTFFTISDNENNLNGNVDFHVDVYDGASWNDSLFFSDTNSLGGTWEQIIVDLSQLTITGPIQLRFVVDENNGTLFDDDRAIDDVVVEETPSCLAVSGLATTGLSFTTAGVTWTENGTATQWEVEWDTAGYTVGTSLNSAIVNTTSSYTITGLMASTDYDYSVRAICAIGDTSGWVASSFFTGYCTPAPSSVDGQGITNVSFDTVNNTTGAEPGNYGDYSALVGNVAQSTTAAVDITLSTGYTYGTKIWIDWNNDLDFDDAGEEVYFALAPGTNPTTLNATFPVPTTAAVGQYRMRIGGSDNNIGVSSCYTGSWASFEDYTINVIAPPACLPISNQSTSALSFTGATLSWVENGTATQWQVEYGAANFAQGTGTSAIVNNDTFLVVTGLTASTSYDWYVRTICGPGANDTSAWIGVNTFFTGYCTPAPTSVDGSGITNVSFDTVNNTTGAEPGNYADYSALVGNIAQSTTAAVDITLSTGYTYDTQIWIDWNDDLDFSDAGETVYTATSPATNPTTLNATFLVPANAPLGQHRMRIGGGDNPVTECYTGAWASFEDYTVNVISPPACLPISNQTTSAISFTGVTLNWVENGTATQWEVEYGAANFVQGTGTTAIVNNDTFLVVTGLTASTSYDWYVRTICGPGANDTSAWVGANTFFTGYCTPAPTSVDGTGITNVMFDTINNTTGAEPGNYGDYSSMIGNAAQSTTASVDIVFSTAGLDYNTKIWVDWNNDLDFDDAGEEVFTGVSSSANPSLLTATFLVPGTAALGQYRMRIGGTDFAVPTPCYTGSWASYEDYTINVTPPPACIAPNNLVQTIISGDSAEVSWTDPNSTAALSYEISYGAPGFTVGTGTQFSTTSTTDTLTGLVVGGSYDWYVRSFCSATDSTTWTGPNSFRTPCTTSPVGTVLPFVEDWENNTGTISGNGNVVCNSTYTWNLETNNVNGRARFGTDAVLASAGTGAVTLDAITTSAVIANNLILTLDLSAYNTANDLELLFDFAHHGEEPHANDSVWIRGSSTNAWVGVYNLYANRGTAGLYNSVSALDIDAALTAASQVVSSTFQVRFGQEDNFPATSPTASDGFSFDNIEVRQTPKAAIDLPITWDDGATVDLTTIDFGGNVSALVADPTNASNTILQSIKGAGAQVWAGTTFGDSLATPIAFASGTTTIRAVVYSPTAGIEVRLKVEDKTNPAISVETGVTTTVANGWDTLSFNFSNNAAGTGAINFANTYDKMSIFYNFGVSPTAADTFYVDYVEDVSVNAVPPVPAKAAIALPITWDDTANVNYSTIDFGGNTSMLTADPTNASNIVLQSIKGVGAQTWGGTTLGDSLSTAIPFSTGNTTIRAVVYSPTVGTPVRLKVEDYDNPAISVETEVLTTVANAWDTLNFDMSTQVMGTAAINFANTYDKMSIFYNFGTSPTSAETYYVDYVEFGNPPVVPTPDPYYPIGTINTEDATTGIADSLNVDCFTSGIVAGVDLDGNAGINFTIIDMASGSQEGIVIFNFVDINNYVVTEGDSIMVHGYVDQFNGLTQIRVDSISVLATGIALPAPIAVTDLDETTEAKWLSLTGNWVSLSTSGSFSSNLDLTNGTDTIIMRIDSDTDVNDSLNASNPIAIGDTICGLLGIGGQFDNTAPRTEGYQIFPMRWSDLTICRLSTGINDTEVIASEFKLVPNPTNGLFEIRSSGFNNATINISIRDISGRLISSEIVNNANGNFTKSFDLNEESAGIYFITIIDGESVINEKLILK